MVDNQFASELKITLDRLCNAVENLKDRQEVVADDVLKIKEAVYNPDVGLYARLKELEQWKERSSKMIWTLFTSVIGIAAALIVKLFP